MVTDGRKVTMIGSGTFKGYIFDSLNKKVPIKIKDVVFCPNMGVNILSITKFLSDGGDRGNMVSICDFTHFVLFIIIILILYNKFNNNSNNKLLYLKLINNIYLNNIIYNNGKLKY